MAPQCIELKKTVEELVVDFADYSGANGSTIPAKWLHPKTKSLIRVLAIN
jgi:hypothetical protein